MYTNKKQNRSTQPMYRYVETVFTICCKSQQQKRPCESLGCVTHSLPRFAHNQNKKQDWWTLLINITN